VRYRLELDSSIVGIISLWLIQGLIVAAIPEAEVQAIIAGVFLLVNTVLTIYLTQLSRKDKDDRTGETKLTRSKKRRQSRKSSDD
jgi:hypothetical protein